MCLATGVAWSSQNEARRSPSLVNDRDGETLTPQNYANNEPLPDNDVSGYFNNIYGYFVIRDDFSIYQAIMVNMGTIKM